jgi:predicted ArsR family transcriptional regulator
MGDDGGHERQEAADNAGLSGGYEGWVSTDVAAKALGVSPRTVRRMLDRGELQGRLEADGINKAWTVDITSVQRLRDERPTAGRDRREYPVVSGMADATADVVRDLAADLAEARYQLGKAESRIELTAQTESTLREALERERKRADRLEAELREHRGVRPESTRDEPHGPDTDAETSEGVDAPTGQVGRETGVQRRSSWWRRFFGFEDRGAG